MATASSMSNLDHRSSTASTSTVRPNIRSTRPAATGSPHTPHNRQILSPYGTSNSPGSSFRQEEDAVVLELGARFLRAGFEGDSTPMCAVSFGPEGARRVGDYRGWIKPSPEELNVPKKTFTNVDEWSEGHELWRMDIRNLDVGLFEDKIERTIREVYNKYLLTDAGSSRLVIVLPSIVPHPLLSSLLSTIFNRWKFPSITLLPSAVMAAVSAGLRSALIVDIGWEETTITGLYEYREIQSRRSTRAMKMLMHRMNTLINKLAKEQGQLPSDVKDDTMYTSFDACEDIMTRLAWCKARKGSSEELNDDAGADPDPDDDNDDSSTIPDSDVSNRIVSLPLPLSGECAYTDVPFSKFSQPVEDALFAGDTEARDLDDEEMPLDVLVYNTLLALPPDVRGICMSRIIFVGGGSNIPGIRQRILNDVDALVKKLRWRFANGKVVDSRGRQLQEINANQQKKSPSPSILEPPTIASEADEQISNAIDEKLHHAKKDSKPGIHGLVRQVESLGAWAGASLVASLKVRGVVEVDREKFLQHGFAGASRDLDVSALVDRRSAYGSGGVRPGGDRSSWTLGEWG
ncbi:hypothetical protein AJ80_02561 [Polytolypa hystricis UAMH7299]|uniref:Actin-related protein RO7 n=1 Tax=Polytolypa hystricis (strain UAMH7299) TaxID=1447883 RepID=A0A2B7YQK1_POLH7|nr:hypothetical protein AJ80_02561 [Polytolypa hystricis UAMH7299]